MHSSACSRCLAPVGSRGNSIAADPSVAVLASLFGTCDLPESLLVVELSVVGSWDETLRRRSNEGRAKERRSLAGARVSDWL